MKFRIIEIASPTIPGGKALALADEEGNCLDHQVGCSVAFKVDEVGTVTVTFHIDDKDIRLG